MERNTEKLKHNEMDEEVTDDDSSHGISGLNIEEYDDKFKVFYVVCEKNIWFHGKLCGGGLGFTGQEIPCHVPEEHVTTAKDLFGKAVDFPEDTLFLDFLGLCHLIIKSNNEERVPYLEWTWTVLLPSISEIGEIPQNNLLLLIQLLGMENVVQDQKSEIEALRNTILDLGECYVKPLTVKPERNQRLVLLLKDKQDPSWDGHTLQKRTTLFVESDLSTYRLYVIRGQEQYVSKQIETVTEESFPDCVVIYDKKDPNPVTTVNGLNESACVSRKYNHFDFDEPFTPGAPDAYEKIRQYMKKPRYYEEVLAMEQYLKRGSSKAQTIEAGTSHEQ